MPNPTKTHLVLAQDGKSHVTKNQMRARKEAEESCFTGQTMAITDDVKGNPVAAKEFRRIKKLLSLIQRDDAIFEAVINRYCLLLAETANLAGERMALSEQWREADLTALDFLARLGVTEKYMGMIAGIDRHLKAKRDQLLAIEKDNAMTLLGALRTVPKKALNKQAQAQNQWANLIKPG